MVLKTRVLEHLQIMASVPPEHGGFSHEQQRLLRILPTAQELLLFKAKCQPLHAAIGCEHPRSGDNRLKFSVSHQLGHLRQV